MEETMPNLHFTGLQRKQLTVMFLSLPQHKLDSAPLAKLTSLRMVLTVWQKLASWFLSKGMIEFPSQITLITLVCGKGIKFCNLFNICFVGWGRDGKSFLGVLRVWLMNQ